MSTKHGTRFYAHVRAADLACPGCGNVISFGVSRLHATAYDTRTGILRCPHRGCLRTFVIGLMVWPIKLAQRLDKVSRPADHSPLTDRERMQLRALGGGWYALEKKGLYREDRTNVTAAAGEEGQEGQVCTCYANIPDSPTIRNLNCPIHGETEEP